MPYKGNHTKLARNLAVEAADGRFYLKTSGTSMVEALRVAARVDRELFEAVCEGALVSLKEGSALFNLDIDPGKLAQPQTLDDADLEALYLDSDHGRHLLCETWAQTLGAKSKLRTRLVNLLNGQEQLHFDLVKDHMGRHLLAMLG